MMSLSFMVVFLLDVLAAAYRDDDFQFVAIGQSLSGKCAAWHDVSISL